VALWRFLFLIFWRLCARGAVAHTITLIFRCLTTRPAEPARIFGLARFDAVRGANQNGGPGVLQAEGGGCGMPAGQQGPIRSWALGFG